MDIKSELDKIHTEEQWIQGTLNKVDHMNSGFNSQKKLTGRTFSRKAIRTAVAAATIVVLSTGSVFAYSYAQRAKNNNYKPVNTAKSLDHLSDAEKYGVTLQKLNETTANKDISLTCTSYHIQDHTAYIGLNISTVDGSALFDETEDKVAVLSGSGFEDLSVAVDDGKYINYMIDNEAVQKVIAGEESSCMIFMTGDGSDPTSMQYEIRYTDYDNSLDGKKLSFQVSGFGAVYQIFTNIGFKADNLYELLKDGKEATESQFEFSKEAAQKDQGGINYNLLAGDNKIAFSDQYPGCYIDNFGFHQPNLDEKYKTFFMTITCDNESNKDNIKKLALQNIDTGLNETLSYRELNDGRIQITYDVDADAEFTKTNDGIYQETTSEYLKNLTLKLKGEGFGKRIKTNDEEMNFDVQFAPADPATVNSIEVTPNTLVTSEVNNVTAMIEKLSLNSMQLEIAGKQQNVTDDGTNNMKMFGAQVNYAPIISLRNGSTIQVSKMSGSGKVATGEFDYNWDIPSVINVNEVTQITWHGTVIYDAE